MNEPDVFLQADNFISLRTAIIGEDRNLVSVRLLPRWFDSAGLTEVCDSSWIDSAWLYRCPKGTVANESLHYLEPVVRCIKLMVFESPPEFKLVWSGSGHSIAVYLNGEPWAFIDEKTRKGYSKGIVDPSIGCQWDEVLFNKVFGKAS